MIENQLQTDQDRYAAAMEVVKDQQLHMQEYIKVIHSRERAMQVLKVHLLNTRRNCLQLEQTVEIFKKRIVELMRDKGSSTQSGEQKASEVKTDEAVNQQSLQAEIQKQMELFKLTQVPNQPTLSERHEKEKYKNKQEALEKQIKTLEEAYQARIDAANLQVVELNLHINELKQQIKELEDKNRESDRIQNWKSYEELMDEVQKLMERDQEKMLTI